MTGRLLTIWAIFAGWLVSSVLLGATPAGKGFLDNGVTAHRGNSGEFVENTLPAFRSGIEVGADWLELDIYLTRDGKLVVIHDRTTRRVGDKDLAVVESTFDELRTVDVATDFRKRRGQTVETCPPQRIPLLEDVLRLAMTQHKTRVSIQPKMACVAEAIALVKRLGAEPWVGFNEGKSELLAEVKELAPGVPVFWDRVRLRDDDVSWAKEHGFEAIVVRQDGLTAEGVARIRQAGLVAGAWTVDDEATMMRLLEMGVQRLYTDFPARLLALKKARADAKQK